MRGSKKKRSKTASEVPVLDYERTFEPTTEFDLLPKTMHFIDSTEQQLRVGDSSQSASAVVHQVTSIGARPATIQNISGENQVSDKDNKRTAGAVPVASKVQASLIATESGIALTDTESASEITKARSNSEGNVSRPRGRPRKSKRHDWAPQSKPDMISNLDSADRQIEPQRMMKVRADGKLSSPKSRRVSKIIVPATEESETSSRETAVKSLQRRKEQAIMEIHPDGKLSSIKPLGPTGIAKAKSTRRHKRLNNLLVIRYGINGEFREYIGEKIEEILARPIREDTPQPGIPVASVPSMPAKMTHPFFLEKPTVKSDDPSKIRDTSSNLSQFVSNRDEQGTDFTLMKKSSPRKPKAPVNISHGMGQLIGTPITLGASKTRQIPGAVSPIWPPRGMVHVRPESDVPSAGQVTAQRRSTDAILPTVTAKYKEKQMNLPEREEITSPYRLLLQSCRAETTGVRTAITDRCCAVRFPNRIVTTGRELQHIYQKKFSGSGSRNINDQDELDIAQSCDKSRHVGPSMLFDRMQSSLTAFDRFECESQDWAHKFAPQTADEVLQPGREALILRDWLRSHAVNSVNTSGYDTGIPREDAFVSKKLSTRVRKRKRKRVEALNDFVVSSGEEESEMDELVDDYNDVPPGFSIDPKRTVIRARDAARLSASPNDNEKPSNALVISGPHGCGKTAAAYAAARELNYEIFEINPGCRRSGRDILDKVGELTRNHIVHQTCGAELDEGSEDGKNMRLLNDTLTPDRETRRQDTMNSFFMPKKETVKKISGKDKLHKGCATSEVKPQRNTQKQSMILLEEADVLFEEDKQFWSTTMELIRQSKRPVVMTCTDESMLPLVDLPLFAILRLKQPSEKLALEYLSLLACNEGHLVSQEAVLGLYRIKGYDLRSSITELQFFCQMAIGDPKGGLDWMLIQPASKSGSTAKARPQRVVSEGAYPPGIGWIGRSNILHNSENQAKRELELLLEIWQFWRVDLAEWQDFLPNDAPAFLPSTTRHGNLSKLENLDLVYDSLSAADILPSLAFQDELDILLDTSQPTLSENSRANFVEGLTVLEADPLVDFSGLGASIPGALRIAARRTLQTLGHKHTASRLDEQAVMSVLPQLVQGRAQLGKLTPNSLSITFEALARPSKGITIGKGPAISCFDRPTSIVAEDLAPYVRSIVRYDQRLEEQRNLLASTSRDGHDSGKRIRTTRASRAALEGGSKASTRRERWFPSDANFCLILKSGGAGWQNLNTYQNAFTESSARAKVPRSRRSSAGSSGNVEMEG